MIDRTVDAAPVIACSPRECVGETILVLFNAVPGDSLICASRRRGARSGRPGHRTGHHSLSARIPCRVLCADTTSLPGGCPVEHCRPRHCPPCRKRRDRRQGPRSSQHHRNHANKGDNQQRMTKPWAGSDRSDWALVFDCSTTGLVASHRRRRTTPVSANWSIVRTGYAWANSAIAPLELSEFAVAAP